MALTFVSTVWGGTMQCLQWHNVLMAQYLVAKHLGGKLYKWKTVLVKMMGAKMLFGQMLESWAHRYMG